MTDSPPRDLNVWGQRGNIRLPRIKKGPNGERLCRWCWGAVPKGRLYWCGPGCVTDYRQRADWNFIRDQIIKRDIVCRCCGGARYSPVGGKKRAAAGWQVREVFYLASRRWGKEWRSLVWGPFNALELRWEVDHIVSVVQGGTDDPANLRLLCAPCHYERTATWARDRAAGTQTALSLD